MQKPLVGIIMGSESDLLVMQEAAKLLDEFTIPYEFTIVSAHRTPDRMVEYAQSAESRGLRIIIAGAGGAAHLPGMTAALTVLPVIGVPIKGKNLDGVDSFLSIVQMPPGVPVATVAINGAKNAGLLAVKILGISDPVIRDALRAFAQAMSDTVKESARRIENKRDAKTTILRETDFKNLGEKKVGKVRDIYIQPERIILVATDRHSSFDRIIAHIPHKGQVLNQISAFWFEMTKDIAPNHFLAMPHPNVLVAKKCTPLPIEMVVRGYITGVTDTSLWTHYQKGQRDFGNFILQEGLKKNQKLDTPVLTPTTKSDIHDRPVTPKEIVSEGILSQEVWDEVAEKALKLFARGQEIAQARGLILADTKYEFGVDETGKVLLIDEIHTPDSSRYWQAKSYDERFEKGEEPEYFDKEFLRLWFKKHCDPYHDAVLPEAPQELIDELSRRYIHVYQQITQQPFVIDVSADMLVSLKKNLEPYACA